MLDFDTIEECFMLKGDILLGQRGVMGPGYYFWRPPHVEHGPMYTINPGMFFFRSKGGSLSTLHVEGLIICYGTLDYRPPTSRRDLTNCW
jgi:hypothetical protein